MRVKLKNNTVEYFDGVFICTQCDKTFTVRAHKAGEYMSCLQCNASHLVFYDSALHTIVTRYEPSDS